MFVFRSTYEKVLNEYVSETGHLWDEIMKLENKLSEAHMENKNLWKLLHPKIKGQPRDKDGRFTKKVKK